MQICVKPATAYTLCFQNQGQLLQPSFTPREVQHRGQLPLGSKQAEIQEAREGDNPGLVDTHLHSGVSVMAVDPKL